MDENFKLLDKVYKANKIELYGVSLMVIKARHGFLACGYVNLETAEKLGHACAIVTGVKNFDDMLGAKVCAVSSSAKSLGVNVEMSGADALALLD